MLLSKSSPETTRRMFLGQHAGNVGLLALAAMLNDQNRGTAAEAQSASGHDVQPRAKSVICLFQNGGPHADFRPETAGPVG
ncbi:MAG: hypothetical protein H7Z17_17780 [Fuerstia sp.]|nr:hypothetical protein [Fuerstiella sp.]